MGNLQNRGIVDIQDQGIKHIRRKIKSVQFVYRDKAIKIVGINRKSSQLGK